MCHDYHPDGYGVICTNNCEHRPTCAKPRRSLLIYAASVECRDRKTDHPDQCRVDGMDIVSIQPDAYINDLVYYDPGHMDKEILNTSCANSGCHNVIPVLKQQWDKFTEVYHQKYCRVVLSYCSKHCQEEHFNHISKSPWLVVTQHMPQNEDTMKVFVFSAAACRV